MTIALLVGSLLAGAAIQWHGASDRFRDVVWQVYFGVLTPLLLFCSFSILDFDHRLSVALAAAIAASWLVLGFSLLYASLVSRDWGERLALGLGAGFGNTSFVGYPLAQLVYGHSGVALAVLYDRLAFIVPALSVSTMLAQLLGPKRSRLNLSSHLGVLIVNPPILAMLLALALRWAGVDVPFADTGQTVLSTGVAPTGFFLLGLSLPLEWGPRMSTGELSRACGALAIRFSAGVLALYGTGLLLGASIPRVFYLMAGMPTAFHLIVVARVYDLRPNLMRFLVAVSTVVAVAAVALAVAIRG